VNRNEVDRDFIDKCKLEEVGLDDGRAGGGGRRSAGKRGNGHQRLR
jgi:hypothetical protein